MIFEKFRVKRRFNAHVDSLLTELGFCVKSIANKDIDELSVSARFDELIGSLKMLFEVQKKLREEVQK